MSSERQAGVAAPPPVGTLRSDETAAWLAETAFTVADCATIVRSWRSHPELVTALHAIAAQDGPKARLCRFLAFEGEHASCTYDDLQAAVSNRSRRTLRYHVHGLHERGVVARVDHPSGATVEWPDDTTYLLASEILAMHERTSEP